MSVNVKRFACTPDEVFAVLADPWVYPTWVVGASRLRAADPAYPEPGTKLHHSIGVWPLVLNDETEVLEWDPPRRMVLTAKTRPPGEERVIIEAKPRGDGCVVRMEEFPSAGPVRLIPTWLADLALRIRNAETLRRLEYVAIGRAGR
ncbi:SRPBCC family protein [Leifsonia poae]|uniref:Polyketide cyclase n=1 Tax=Leifsonia poae TaxID=110933 RepID=A0A9W6H891_9MICO|nr:SRPBCC family protein [Leifsonia poae]GLJ75487.1 polyketide cyclase [Leifsonia poae]